VTRTTEKWPARLFSRPRAGSPLGWRAEQLDGVVLRRVPQSGWVDGSGLWETPLGGRLPDRGSEVLEA
jgi:hypothetical protein